MYVYVCILWCNPLFGTLEPEGTVLAIELSSFQGLKTYNCIYQIIVNHLVQVACVHIRGLSTTQGSGLEGFYCI